MTHRRFGVWVSLALVGLSGCVTAPTTSTKVDLTPESATSVWQPCGDIECVQVQVPVDYSRPDGELVSLAVYRRVSTTSPDANPVVLIPDYRWGDDARALVELAPLHLGSAWTAQTLISISRRGTGASPMPAGSEHFVSTRDVARDIESVRQFFDLGAMRAMGWGTGATALALLAQESPDSIAYMVLDGPTHPMMSAQERVSAQIVADNAMVAEAMRWCVSHISCPLHANFVREFNLFRTNMRLDIVDPAVTSVVVARAARNAFAIADPQAFFTGITQATVGDATVLLNTAGEGATAGEIQIVCADETRGSASLIAQELELNHADVNRFFSLGDDHLVYAQCGELPESGEPLKDLTAQSEAANVNALVIVAENNPVVPASMSTALAQQFFWETYAVPLWRHLVVGYDDAVTQRALDFLLNNKPNS
jgi:pimeloyl-ACP methyl ester carboxylesterase